MCGCFHFYTLRSIIWHFKNFVNFPKLENREAHHTLFVGGGSGDWIFSLVFKSAACISQFLVPISVSTYLLWALFPGEQVLSERLRSLYLFPIGIFLMLRFPIYDHVLERYYTFFIEVVAKYFVIS